MDTLQRSWDVPCSTCVPVQQTLNFLRRVLQLERNEYVRLAMLECIHDEVSVAGRSGPDNCYSRLQSLLAHVSHGVFDEPAAIDVVTGWVDVDLCMVRWRSFYHTHEYGMGWHQSGLAPLPVLALRRMRISHMVCH